MTARRALVALVAAMPVAPACVAEHDVDVYVVLPARCADLGARRVAIDVDTSDGEHFAVAAEACSDHLAGQDVSGFTARLERLGAEFHRAEVVVEDAAGAPLGGRSLPFPGDGPLVLGLTRADLPGWPIAAIDVTIPVCVATSAVGELRLTATLGGDPTPLVDQLVPCTGTSPAAPRIELPRGRVAITAEAACWRGTADAVVEDGAALELALTRSCP